MIESTSCDFEWFRFRVQDSVSKLNVADTEAAAYAASYGL